MLHTVFQPRLRGGRGEGDRNGCDERAVIIVAANTLCERRLLRLAVAVVDCVLAKSLTVLFRSPKTNPDPESVATTANCAVAWYRRVIPPPVPRRVTTHLVLVFPPHPVCLPR